MNPAQFLVIGLCLAGSFDAAARDAEAVRRGRSLYVAHCAVCHQATGRGTPGLYPPLAGSDFLARPDGRTNAILAVVQGLSGKLVVNGSSYDNQMPAVVLDDGQVADVLSHVFNSWTNPGGEFTAEEISQVRASSRFPTFKALADASAYPPLPPAPAGWELREHVRLNEFAVRMAPAPDGNGYYLLGQAGAVWRVDASSRKVQPVFVAADYVDPALGSPGTLGMHCDTSGRLWITCNQRQDSLPLVTNHVSIFRTPPPASNRSLPGKPTLWFRTAYPYGIGPYNHGVSHLAIGPDRKLYVSSGSRTDGGEPGNEPNLGRMGETDITACLWRMDPESESPSIEVIARGIRNAWSFAWDDAGRLFSVSNGPDAHSGEEMDVIDVNARRHHGFPYQFADWPVERKAYPHTPPAPPGLSFVLPVVNDGPDGWAAGLPGATFDPHSSPAGMIRLGNGAPQLWRRSFLVGRFGNLLKMEGDRDVGFDVLAVEPTQVGNAWRAKVRTFVRGLGRPIDLMLLRDRVYILEYTRPTDFRSGRGWLPGRVLELIPKPEGR
jgi:glucose/arabinose dehydrogenase/mono/diheme cytochrome c family protein